MRILIAEDDYTSRTILSAVLTKDGYDIVEATDGPAALNALRQDDAPRLALLDWIMPGMDGIDVLKCLREAPSDYPAYVLMLTARNGKSDIAEALDAGADDYLVKPFNMNELRARVSVGRRMLDLQDRLHRRLDDLQEAITHIKHLQGILPICSFCKKIRDDEGYWDRVEAYISRHSDAMFSHTCCPECMEREYPEFWERQQAALARERGVKNNA